MFLVYIIYAANYFTLSNEQVLEPYILINKAQYSS
jgi:hypothetical protein